MLQLGSPWAASAVLADVSRIPLRLDLIALPASAIIIIIVSGAASLPVGRAMALSGRSRAP
jgi:hypothetical protein